MWKAARSRHWPLGTSELLNIVLAVLLLPKSPAGSVWLTKPVWKIGVLYPPIREPITLQALRSAYVSRRMKLPEIVENHHINVIRLPLLRTDRFAPPLHSRDTEMH